jgi:hypothetical protein
MKLANGSLILWLQHNFPKHVASFHILVGRADFRQWKRPVHDRLQPSGKYMAQYFV